MKYFQHRPFSFWLGAAMGSVVVLFASFIIGTAAPSPTTTPPHAESSRFEAGFSLMSAYGEVLVATNITDAKDAVTRLRALAESCATWGVTGCADVRDKAQAYLSGLEEVAGKATEEGDGNGDATTTIPEPSETPDPWFSGELASLRRDLGAAINTVVSASP